MIKKIFIPALSIAFALGFVHTALASEVSGDLSASSGAGTQSSTANGSLAGTLSGPTTLASAGGSSSSSGGRSGGRSTGATANDADSIYIYPDSGIAYYDSVPMQSDAGLMAYADTAQAGTDASDAADTVVLADSGAQNAVANEANLAGVGATGPGMGKFMLAIGLIIVAAGAGVYGVNKYVVAKE